MSIVGLIGGLGPESTIAYYRQILDRYKEKRPDDGAPPILITSLDVQRMVALMTQGKLDEALEYLIAEVRRLANGGATFAAITANTPHLLFDRLVPLSPIPLLSIVAAARDTVLQRKLSRLALLGTRFTMEAPLYPEVFSPAGLTVVLPGAEERSLIHDRYIGQLIPGQFLQQTRDEIVGIIDRMIDEERIDGVILGGTELPLLLTEPEHRGVPLLDTTAIHVEAIVDRLLS